MNKYITIVILVLFFAASTAQAQVPGYLGKRCLVGATFTPIVNLTFPNAKLKTGLFAITYQFSANAEYVVSKKLSLGFNLGGCRTGWGGVGSFEAGDKRLNVMESGLCINYYRYYHRGAIAPLGDYLTFGLNMFTYVPSVPKGTVVTNPYYISDHWARLYGVHAYVNIGKKWLFMDRFMAGLCVSTGIYLTSYGFNSDEYYLPGKGGPKSNMEAERYYRNDSSYRIKQLGAFNASVSLAYLLF